MIFRMKNFVGEFREFAVKGNMVDLAVGLIIGTAFNKIVNSLVTDIILPPIGLLLKKADFASFFISLNGQYYPSFAEAQKAGAPTLNYGIFIDNVISFLITAFVIFLVVRQLNRIRRKREQVKSPTTKPCPYCHSVINIKATRCPECTSTIS
jgi:large conductance mechanosensitive channel